MGRVCMGRVGYGPSLCWAEFVMGRDVQLPFEKVREVMVATDVLNLYTIIEDHRIPGCRSVFRFT